MISHCASMHLTSAMPARQLQCGRGNDYVEIPCKLAPFCKSSIEHHSCRMCFLVSSCLGISDKTTTFRPKMS